MIPPKPASFALLWSVLWLHAGDAHAAAPTPHAAAATATATATAPATEPALTQEQLLARWLDESSEVQAWRTSTGAQRFDELTAKLLPNPELGVDVVKALGGVPPDGKFGLAGTLSMPVPVFGQIGARKKAARTLTEAAEAQLLVQLWNRAGELCGLMLERAFADAEYEQNEQVLRELERVETVIEKRVAAGASGPYDLLRVRIERGQRVAARDNAEVARAHAEAALLAALAIPGLQSAPITRKGLRDFAGPEQREALQKQALQRRPDLLLAKREAAAARAGAASARREAVPVPELSATPYYIGGPYGFQLTVGVNVPMPIFDRNQGKSKRGEQEARASDQSAEMLQTRIHAEVAGAFQARAAASAALQRYRDQTMPSAQELIARAETSYTAGGFSIAELFDAYSTVWAARAQELSLVRQRAQSELALEFASVLVLPTQDAATAARPQESP